MLKNIIIINDFAYEDGGASQVAILSALGLAKRGYYVNFFCSVGPISPRLTSDNLTVRCVGRYDILRDPNRVRATINGLWNMAAAKSLSQQIKYMDKTNTIIHLHSWTKALSSSVIRTVLKRNFPVICTLHDYFVACPNGNFFNYTSNKICKFRALSLPCLLSNCDKRNYRQKLWRLVRSYIQARAGMMPRGLKHFIFVSKFSSSILSDYLPDASISYYVDNPIDVSPKIPVTVANNQYFIYVGRLSPEKGVVSLAKTLTKENIKFLILGDGECRKELSNTIPEQMIVGWVPHDMVSVYFKKARALLLPSLSYETQGLVVLEAAAHGVPAVVPDSCAARDLVVDNETGLWYRGGDFEDLLAKVRLLEDNKLVYRLGNGAYRNFWLNSPNLDNHLNKLIHVYETILRQT